MQKDKVWETIEGNSQRVAKDNELIQPGASFKLTEHQTRAIDELAEKLEHGVQRILLKAPTGSGKTEVFTRTAVGQILRQNRHVVIVTPTRDLARQQANYLADRLAGTGLEVAQIHAGIPPRSRRDSLAEVAQGKIQVIVGSALLIQSSAYRKVLESSALVVIDDVNAFDEDEDLVHLIGLHCPILYVTATPEAVGRFLRREKAMDNLVEMFMLPFDSPPTTVHNEPAAWNENIFNQIDRGMAIMEKHINAGSRVYCISRTRARVPVIAKYLQDRFGIPVSILHGEMADSVEHQSRQRKTGTSGGVTEDRVSMMKQFRENSPAILVATNLVGSGLDVPLADMVLVTDADHFGEAEIEQLLGRVGRRERASDAVLIKGTTATIPRSMSVRATTRIRNGKVVQTFRRQPASRRGYNPRRMV